MANLIPRPFIDDVLARTDLVDLIDSRVPLKKSGAHYVACCPFHQEKTPSFSVSRSKQFYHCFGCGASGNAISFLMSHEHQTFVEAVESLAQSAGLSLPEDTPSATPNPTSLTPLYAAQQAAATFYAQRLNHENHGRIARTYLERRGISPSTQQQFLLGYAPAEWRNLPQQETSQKTLIECGLLIQREDGRCYDRFRDRLMFPIRDRRGRIVGFGGRVLNQDTPKYLNSPETTLFKKHKEVYGLFELLQAQPKPDQIIVTEGYMDVVALAEHGIPNCVATLGTAICTEQVNLLLRQTHSLVFCFDGDKAGQKAAWKALEASLPALRDGKQVHFLRLPEEHDPDSYIRSEGREAFTAQLKQATPCSRYLFETLSAANPEDTLENRSSLASQAKPLIEKLPPGHFRELMEQTLQERTGQRKAEPAAQTSRPAKKSIRVAHNQPSIWRELGTMIAHQPELLRLANPNDRIRLQRHPKLGPLVGHICSQLEDSSGLSTGQLLEGLRETPAEQVLQQLLGHPLTPGLDDDTLPAQFSGALARLQIRERQERLNLLIDKSRQCALSPEEREELRQLTSSHNQ